MLALGLGATGLALSACPPPAQVAPSPPPGCGKDTDCKLDRICVAGACVDPPPRRFAREGEDGGAEDGALAPGPDASAAVPPEPPPDGGVADASPPPAPLGPSPAFHGDPQHTGRSRFRAPREAPREVARVATGGAVFSSPALTHAGLAIFGSHDRVVYAAGPDGAVRWRRPTGDLVWSSPALGPGGAVYVGSDDDHLYALDAADGAVRWRFRAGSCRVAVGSGPEAARCDVDGITVGPEGTIYLSADGLYALTPTGALRWRFSPGSTHCAGAPALGLDGTVLVGCHDHALYAVDRDTGQKRWEFRAGDDIDSAPTVGPDGTVYFGSDDRKLYAVAPGGVLRFAVVTRGAIRGSPALGPDGTIYVGSFDGALYAVRPGGTVSWSYRTADRILGSPVVDAAGLVLVGSQDDRLYALLPDGTLAWSVLLAGDVDGTPALGADGTIYVGADDRALHILAPSERSSP